MTDEEARALAHEQWASDDLEIDDDAKISHVENKKGEEVNAWVQAWVWVEGETE